MSSYTPGAMEWAFCWQEPCWRALFPPASSRASWSLVSFPVVPIHWSSREPDSTAQPPVASSVHLGKPTPIHGAYVPGLCRLGSGGWCWCVPESPDLVWPERGVGHCRIPSGQYLYRESLHPDSLRVLFLVVWHGQWLLLIFFTVFRRCFHSEQSQSFLLIGSNQCIKQKQQ